VAVEIPNEGGGADIWTIELARGVASRVTFDPASDIDPVWSPDGAELLFASDRSGTSNIFRKRL
jgi:eukaryotic-like serine/threonine-protein kinase